jgi:hypothetical protein
MTRLVACAVIRDDPPQVLVADDLESLNWVLALRVIARTPGSELAPHVRDALRRSLREERWGDAVELWMRDHPEVDVYPSVDSWGPGDVELGAQELEFTPLFSDG